MYVCFIHCWLALVQFYADEWSPQNFNSMGSRVLAWCWIQAWNIVGAVLRALYDLSKDILCLIGIIVNYIQGENFVDFLTSPQD